MNILIYILIILLSFAFMEFAAWFTHKYVMHGFMWKFHKDHHQKVLRWLPLELNDVFVVIFAVPSFLFIFLGILYKNNYNLSIGIGLTLYGIAYFFVHEIIVHNRFKWNFKMDNKYVQAVRKAHKVHHSFTDKDPSNNFGFVFLIPIEYFSHTNKD